MRGPSRGRKLAYGAENLAETQEGEAHHRSRCLHSPVQHRTRLSCKDNVRVDDLLFYAGPERSGSTWLFNAIRLLYQDAKEPLDPFWITSLSAEALSQRGAGAL